MKTQIINKLTKNILLGILATSVILILTSCEKKIKFHYQPTKTKNLSILFLYYSYSNVYDVVISFFKTLPPIKKGTFVRLQGSCCGLSCAWCMLSCLQLLPTSDINGLSGVSV